MHEILTTFTCSTASTILYVQSTVKVVNVTILGSKLHHNNSTLLITLIPMLLLLNKILAKL
jgi:hypothetical protein